MRGPTRKQHESLAKMAADLAREHGATVARKGAGWDAGLKHFFETDYRLDTVVGPALFSIGLDGAGAHLHMRFEGDPEVIKRGIHWPELNRYTYRKCNVYAATAPDICRIADARLGLIAATESRPTRADLLESIESET